MSSTNRAEENRITVSELDMLLSWMLGGMHAQIYALCKGGVPASEFHMIFPVCDSSTFSIGSSITSKYRRKWKT